jgi:hypothetical protein
MSEPQQPQQPRPQQTQSQQSLTIVAPLIEGPAPGGTPATPPGFMGSNEPMPRTLGGPIPDGEGTPLALAHLSGPAPRVNAVPDRPEFLEPISTGSSAVSSPIDKGRTDTS